MAIEDIFNEELSREEKVSTLRDYIRAAIDESAKRAIHEKYEKKESDAEDEDVEDEEGEVREAEDNDEDDDEDDDEDEESDRRGLDESFEVEAVPVGGKRGRVEKFTINQLSQLKKLAKTMKYGHFSVRNTRTNLEDDFVVDPQGNLIKV